MFETFHINMYIVYITYMNYKYVGDNNIIKSFFLQYILQMPLG